MSVRIGVAPGPLPAGPAARELFWRFVDDCEASDIDSIWISDLMASTAMNLEVMTALAAIIGRTRRLKVGTSVLALPLRHPTIVAKELATIDLLSAGRILPAVTPGLALAHQFEACGVSQRERGRRTDEAIVLIRRLWSENDVTHEGQFYRLHGVTVLPKPYGRIPPIWIGGREPAAWRRTGYIGDGWLPSAVTPPEMARGIAAIRLYAREVGREIEEDNYGATLGYYIGASAAEAETRAVTPAVRRRTDVELREYSAFGSPEDVAATLTRYVEAGASTFVLRPMCPSGEVLHQIGLLATDVVPRFHGRRSA